MSKSTIGVIISLVVVVVGAAATAYILGSSKTKEATDSFGKNLTTSPAQSKKIEEDTTKTFTDEAGFSFQYPDTSTVEDVTPDSSDYYTKLIIKSATGSISLIAQDTKFATIDDWMKSDKSAPKSATLTGATSLGSLQAKQYTATGTLYTVAIDSKVLYLIQGPSSLSSVQDTIAQSFKFAGTETNVSSGGTASGDIVEEEGLIE